MKSLQTLIKLQKTRVDEQRQLLAQLENQLAYIERRIAELEVYKAREQVTADQNEEARATYGAFVKGAVAKGREMEKERLTATEAVRIAHDKLAELFEEQKRYEIAEQARIDAEAKEESKRERQELDEVGSIGHQRRREE
ncbi:MAG: hypothetical protein JO126_00055 [Alphaproteobacteria bacterium]|nr:hypothetical protein [Alphaproteobacteria bacterium]